jgi:hypothetical protein
MSFILFVALSTLGQGPPQPPGTEGKPLEKSAYFAFVDREFIFTLEVVKPGVPILNFVSLSDEEDSLFAKEIRVTFEDRRIPGRLFAADTGDPKQPIKMPSLHVHPRSSFGVRIEGEFDGAKELEGVEIRYGGETFKLAPLTSLGFENLVQKVNRINLGSPDFNDDWLILKFETLGTRSRAGR